jgi:hypothetical protein
MRENWNPKFRLAAKMTERGANIQIIAHSEGVEIRTKQIPGKRLSLWTEQVAGPDDGLIVVTNVSNSGVHHCYIQRISGIIEAVVPSRGHCICEPGEWAKLRIRIPLSVRKGIQFCPFCDQPMQIGQTKYGVVKGQYAKFHPWCSPSRLPWESESMARYRNSLPTKERRSLYYSILNLPVQDNTTIANYYKSDSLRRRH